jgi:hypothetical protein
VKTNKYLISLDLEKKSFPFYCQLSKMQSSESLKNCLLFITDCEVFPYTTTSVLDLIGAMKFLMASNAN